MYKTDTALLDRIGRDNREKTPKLGRNPIGKTMSTQENAKIVAALASANQKLKLFPQK